MSSSKPSWIRRFHVPKAHRRPPSMVFQANSGLPSFDVASTSDSLGFVTLASPKNPEIDIIFVHGIDGGSFSSWARNGDPKYYWPKEWLPNEVGLGRARIHTYGYNVDPKRNTNAHMDFARQLLCDLICSPLWFGKLPIVFVGHSTGGLVVKNVFTLAKMDRYAQRIAANIKAIIFLATPQNPLKRSTFKKWRKMNRHLADKAYFDHVETSLSIEFRALAHDVKSVSFTKKSSTYLGIGKTFQVNSNTARLWSQENLIQLHGTHYSIAKFRSTNDSNYMLFYGKLSELIEEIRPRRVGRMQSTFERSPSPPPRYSSLPIALHG